jgi:hypothetical protein
MRPTASVFRFVPVAPCERVGPLVCAGKEEPARRGGGTSVDGLWREVDRPDGGVLFLLIDVEGKGRGSTLLRELIEQVLDDPRTWGKRPGDLLVELHSLAGSQWAETERTFVAQAVLVHAEGDHFLVASAGLPLPCHAPGAEGWRTLEVPAESIGLLGRPDIHGDGEPVFPDRHVDLTAEHRYLAVTDGITEAGRPRILGSAALLVLLNSLPDQHEPDAVLQAVFALAAQHDGATWPGDDATGLSWRIDGSS